MLPSTIMVPTDGSTAANAAVMFAADMAKTMKASKVILVSVIPRAVAPLPEFAGTGVAPVPVAASAYSSSEVLEVLQKDLVATWTRFIEGEAKKVRSTVGDTIQVETRLLTGGYPAGAILEESHREGTCDHIVIGDKGDNPIPGLKLGSVTHHVIMHADCPVTVIRA